MAYNLEPTVQILEQILQPDHHLPWILDPFSGDGIERLKSQISDATHEAENILESHMADQILSDREGQSFTFSPPSLHKVIEELDFAGKEIKKMMDIGINPLFESSSSPAVDSSRSQEKACFLKELFENPSPPSRDGTERLESQIRDAVHEAENIIESHMADQILSVCEGQSFTVSPPSLQYAVEKLDSAGKDIKKMMDIGINPISEISPSPVAESSRSQDPNPKKILVGINKDLDLKNRLIGQPPKVDIIPIVGMGGIGKTTLARNVYDDPSIAFHFDTRAWITVSQDYDVQAILLGLLHCIIGELTVEMLKEKNPQLGQHLHQSLYGKRYLIVLDDLWDIRAWHDTRTFFPEYKNGSRVLITTREMNVADLAAGTESSHHQMNFLDEVESWNLLCQQVFQQKYCAPEFHKTGKKIAKNCGGLPLAIHVIGGFLSQANRTQEYWEQVARMSAQLGSTKMSNSQRYFL